MDWKLLTFLCLSGACSSCNANDKAKIIGVCSTMPPQISFIQILSASLDAGMLTRDSFRLTQDGAISRAIWTDENELISISYPTNIGSDSYDIAIEALKEIEQQEEPRTAKELTTYRPAFSFEVAHLDSQDGSTYFHQGDQTDTLENLIISWSQKISMNNSVDGTFVWTMPAPKDTNRIDLPLLVPSDCDSMTATAIAESYIGRKLAISVPPELSEYNSGENTGRSRYVAQSPDENIYFGVVSSR